jgi:hypothetical protein
MTGFAAAEHAKRDGIADADAHFVRLVTFRDAGLPRSQLDAIIKQTRLNRLAELRSEGADDAWVQAYDQAYSAAFCERLDALSGPPGNRHERRRLAKARR